MTISTKNQLTDITVVTEKKTFWQVVTDHKVVIPQIQRDYAQGRADATSKQIRTSILDKLLFALTVEPVDFDFIYGNVNTENEFIPLDGQQRLTTLFLLHLYLAKRCIDFDADRGLFLKFRYETRQSSTDFCEAIVSKEISFEVASLDEHIKDQRWFFHAWKRDPTIIAMLTMFQSIHEMFNEKDHLLLWQKLKSSAQPPITFNFLNLDNLKLTDDLYVKMNSRGKPLTPFENFKVWFEIHHSPDRQWKEKIDNNWTNLFWHYKDANRSKIRNDYSIDDEFMNFFNGMLMFALNNKDEVTFFNDHSHIPLSRYSKLSCFFNDEVTLIALTLDWLCEHHKDLSNYLNDLKFWQSENVFEKFISGNTTYQQRALFYALVHFIHYSGDVKNLSIPALKRWMRVCRNLIENTPVDNERFISEVKAIQSFEGYCLNIYDYLCQTDIKIPFFLGIQVEEERAKAILISQNALWENELIEAENHELFKGCIQFLLNEISNKDIAIFSAFREAAFILFEKTGIRQEYECDYLFTRALLTQGVDATDIKLLNNAESWRVLLKRTDIQKAMSVLLHDITSKKWSTYLSYLQNCVERFTDNTNYVIYLLVKNPVLLNNSSESRFVRKYRDGHTYLYNNANGNWINNYNQVLLSNYRNDIIVALCKADGQIKPRDSSKWWVIIDEKTNNTFYRGLDVWLSKSVIIENIPYDLQFKFEGDRLVMGLLTMSGVILQITSTNYARNKDWSIYCLRPFGYINDQYVIMDWVLETLDEANQMLASVRQESAK